MKSKNLWSGLLVLVAVPLASCTAKYEDAIRDRDLKREADREMRDRRR